MVILHLISIESQSLNSRSTFSLYVNKPNQSYYPTQLIGHKEFAEIHFSSYLLYFSFEKCS